MQLEFEANDNKKYEVNGIRDSAVYAKESTASQLPGLYYLVPQKGYPKEENTWEPASAIQHFQRLVTAYYKDNLEKSTAISLPIDTAALMAKPMQSQPARPMTALTKKRSQPTGPRTTPTKKRGRLARSTITTKQAKKSQTSFLLDLSWFSF